MVKRPFFNGVRSRLSYGVVEARPEGIRQLEVPGVVNLVVYDGEAGAGDLKVGTRVKTAQRLEVSESGGAVNCPVTGVISSLSDHRGYSGRCDVRVYIEVTGDEQFDEGVVEAAEASDFDGLRRHLISIPGKADFSSLLMIDPPVNRVVVHGVDEDLLVLTRRLMVQSEGLAEGMEYLKKLTRIGRLMVVVPPELSSRVDVEGVDKHVIRPVYPHGLPALIGRKVLDGGSDPGLGFVGPEAVLFLGDLLGRGVISFDKVVTVIGKDQVPEVVKVRIGTPVAFILSELGIEVAHGDRVILGGPMRGRAISDLEEPVMWDTDGIMVQAGSEVILTDDGQCINCGECIRVCPVRVPVNMLVRVLGSGLYEEAAERYDLDSCIECGLCDYVCVARIPIFHHIMLGKQEVMRLGQVEGVNG